MNSANPGPPTVRKAAGVTTSRRYCTSLPENTTPVPTPTGCCIICGRRPADGAAPQRTCTRCEGHTRVRLAELRAYYDQLGQEMQPRRGAGQRITGTRSPPTPARLGPLSLRGPSPPPGSAVIDDPQHDQHGPPALAGALQAWAVDVCAHFGYTQTTPTAATRRAVADTVRFLTAQLARIGAEYPAAAQLNTAILQLHYHCRAELGEIPGTLARIPCRHTLDDGHECGQPMRLTDIGARHLQCHGCGTIWPRGLWPTLGR